MGGQVRERLASGWAGKRERLASGWAGMGEVS